MMAPAVGLSGDQQHSIEKVIWFHGKAEVKVMDSIL